MPKRRNNREVLDRSTGQTGDLGRGPLSTAASGTPTEKTSSPVQAAPAQGAARSGRRSKHLPAALCSVVGTVLLVAVIFACLPVVLARAWGYQVYNIVSGSMEPAIPVGSAIYVRSTAPGQLAAGDVIAFEREGTVVAHRVVQNDAAQSQLTTKGDANAKEDLSPVRYNQVIGRVERHIPVLGGLLGLYTSGMGRVYAVCLAVCGALLNMVGARIRRRGEEEAEAETSDANIIGDKEAAAGDEGDAAPAAPAPPAKNWGRRLRLGAMAVLAVVFVGSLGAIVAIQYRYKVQQHFYSQTAGQYTVTIPGATDAAVVGVGDKELAPLVVDFAALQAVNPDIIGWIWCEGTPIHYPVLQTDSNDTYLRHTYKGEYSIAGSIFVEANNRPGFADANTIIYGHHMLDDTMFSCIESWQDQQFYDQHPVLWLLTPQQDYKIEVFSSYMTTAESATYTIFSEPGAGLDAYLQAALDQSAIIAPLQLPAGGRYVLLTTCSFAADDARNVLHGLLTPVGAAREA